MPHRLWRRSPGYLKFSDFISYPIRNERPRVVFPYNQPQALEILGAYRSNRWAKVSSHSRQVWCRCEPVPPHADEFMEEKIASLQCSSGRNKYKNILFEARCVAGSRSANLESRSFKLYCRPGHMPGVSNERDMVNTVVV
jgi:hypothetical protein